MAEPVPSSKLSLKLIIDKKAKKVLFAEAGKEAVDFICSILTLPVGTVTNLLSDQGGMVGCLSDLYQSIQNLDNYYIQPAQHKDTVLKPRVCDATEEASLFSLTSKKPGTPKLYRCNYTSAGQVSHRSNYIYAGHDYVTDMPGKVCPYCSFPMNISVTFVEGKTEAVPIVSKGGFVKGVVNYMVMDDLAISPTSAVIGLSFLNKYNVDVKSLDEKVFDLDMAKGLKLLKASFQTKNVLTEVFIKGQDNMEEDRKPRLVA